MWVTATVTLEGVADFPDYGVFMDVIHSVTGVERSASSMAVSSSSAAAGSAILALLETVDRGSRPSRLGG